MDIDIKGEPVAKYFTQCMLINDNRKHVGFIPKKYAIIGKILTLKGHDGLWQVAEVYKTETEEEVKERERLYGKWREATDI